MAADCEPGDGCCPHHKHYGLGSPHGCVSWERDPGYPFTCVPPPVFSEGQCMICREVVKIGPFVPKSFDDIEQRVKEMHDCAVARG